MRQSSTQVITAIPLRFLYPVPFIDTDRSIFRQTQNFQRENSLRLSEVSRTCDAENRQFLFLFFFFKYCSTNRNSTLRTGKQKILPKRSPPPPIANNTDSLRPKGIILWFRYAGKRRR